jgi:hypothetical protein
MAVEKTPAELANQDYRTDVLSLFNPAKGQAEATKAIHKADGTRAVRYNEDKKPEDPFRIAMILPDGTKEYWAQVNSSYDPVSGFKAMAFEQRDVDGKAILTNGQPHVMVVFPGNTTTKEDLDNSVAVVSGDSSHYFQVREEFMGRVARGMQDRKKEFNFQGVGTVTIGAHSLGANAAVGAAQNLEDLGIKGAETYYYEPVGAGQALQQYAALLAAKHNKTTEPTREQIQAAADKIAANSFSTRSKNDNFSHGQGGDQIHDNGMIGETWELDTGTHPVESHEALNGSNMLLAGARPVRTKDKDLSAQAILQGGTALTPDQQKAAQEQAKAFAEIAPTLQPNKTFNTVAAAPHDEPANAPHANFWDLDSRTGPDPIDPSEEIKKYLATKGINAGRGPGWSPELNTGLGRLFAEAQMTPEYKKAFKDVYKKEDATPDFKPGPATRQAMVTKGVPENVIKAMDELKLFNKSQRDDLYEPPSREDSMKILKDAKEKPLVFPPAQQLAAASAPASVLTNGR